MDPELLRQRQDFKKRASALPTVSRTSKKEKTTDEPAPKRPKPAVKRPKQGDGNTGFDYKTAVSANAAAKFGILHRVVDYMKNRHIDGSNWSLSLEEILQELLLFDVDRKTKEWLNTESLPKNPRLSVEEENRYIYKPPYKAKGKNSLLTILKRQDLDGKGGVLLSDLKDSMANAEKVVEALGDDVIILNTMINKRKDKVVFYNDKDNIAKIDEEFVTMWRSVAVDQLDETKVDEYLVKHGITSMADSSIRKKVTAIPKRKPNRRRANIVHNNHMEGVLQDFSTTD